MILANLLNFWTSWANLYHKTVSICIIFNLQKRKSILIQIIVIALNITSLYFRKKCQNGNTNAKQVVEIAQETLVMAILVK